MVFLPLSTVISALTAFICLAHFQHANRRNWQTILQWRPVILPTREELQVCSQARIETVLERNLQP